MAYDDDDLALARAVLARVGLDTSDAADVLDDLVLDAYAAGAHTGWANLPASVRLAGAEPVATIDWAAWVPGNPLAAAELSGEGAGAGLAQLLDDAGVRIAGIEGSALDDLAATLAEGVANGDSIGTIASALDDTLGTRAEMIANTEVNRAMSLATMDTYEANGIGGVEWLAEDNACEACGANADAGVIALGDEFPSGDTSPPAHPRCRCAISPAELETT